MQNNFIKGLTAGTMVGIAAGMMVSENLNWGTKRKIKRTRRLMKHAANHLGHNLISKF